MQKCLLTPLLATALGVVTFCLFLFGTYLQGRKVHDASVDFKLIAGVPVYNYHLRIDFRDMTGNTLARQLRGVHVSDWLLAFQGQPSDAQVHSVCASLPGGAKCIFEGHPSQGGVPMVNLRATASELEDCLASHGHLLSFVEPDGKWAAIPDDTDEPLASQDTETETELPWGLDRIDDRYGLDGSYDGSVQGGQGVHVYVLDTGIRTTHIDFKGRSGHSRAVPTLEVLGMGIVICNSSDTSCATDRQGHGTHVAGTIGGTSFGVAKGASLHAVKILSDSGSGQFSWFIAALDWVATHGQRPAVISASLGGQGKLASVEQAINAAVQAGVTVVVAAGNSGADACGFTPAYVPAAITVGATARDDVAPSWSNFGQCVDIFAPGVGIQSAGRSSDTASTSLSGTSMACPHVSGAAALLLEKNGTLSPSEVADQLRIKATPGAVKDAPEGTPNLLLYTGDAPPMTTISTTTTPPAFNGHPWFVARGPCTIDTMGCALSPHFPKQYGSDESCLILVNATAALPISVQHFSTEPGYDTLIVNGVTYMGVQGPGGVIPRDTIKWKSDRSVEASGWKLCMGSNWSTTITTTTMTTTTVSTSTTPPTATAISTTTTPLLTTTTISTTTTPRPTTTTISTTAAPAPTTTTVSTTTTPPPTTTTISTTTPLPTTTTISTTTTPPPTTTTISTTTPSPTTTIVSTTTTPSPFNGHPWFVAKGPCSIDSMGCALSPNHPKKYGAGESCLIRVNATAALPISVEHFSTETGYDTLTVNGVTYMGVEGPGGVTPRDTIKWKSDGSVEASGWKLCMGSASSTTIIATTMTTTAVSTTTTMPPTTTSISTTTTTLLPTTTTISTTTTPPPTTTPILTTTAPLPPTTTISTTTTLLPFNGHPWVVAKGPCTIDTMGCALSPNHPQKYGSGELCLMIVNATAASPISVKHFSTEAGWDTLTVNGRSYAGERGPVGVTPRGSIIWRSDRSVQKSGWKLCMGRDSSTTSTTTTMTTTTTPVSIDGLTQEEAALYNPTLGSYWDLGSCGRAGNDNNWAWCGRGFSCQQRVPVDASVCASQQAMPSFKKVFATIDSCSFAYYQQYVCASETTREP